MTQDPLIAFINLTRFDARAVALHGQVDETYEALEKIEHECIAINEKLDTQRNDLHTKQKQKSAFDLELTSAEDQIKIKQRKLDSLSNPKEYFSLTSELEQLKSKKDQLEDQIFSLLNQIEEAQKTYQNEQRNNEALLADLDVRKRAHEMNLKRDRDELQSMEEVRSSLIVGIPEEWLERYEMMRRDINDAAVPVEFDSCSACFHALVGRDLLLMRKRALLQCKQCNRFLYIPDAVYGSASL